MRKVSEGLFFFLTIHASERVVRAPLRCHSHSIQEWSENKSHCSYSNRFIWHDTGMSWICPLLLPLHTRTHTLASQPSVTCSVFSSFHKQFIDFSLKSYKTTPWHKLNLKEKKTQRSEFFRKSPFTSLRWFNFWCVVTWLCWMFNVLKHIGGKRLSDFHRFI